MKYKLLSLGLLTLFSLTSLAQIELIVPLGHSRKIVDLSVSPDQKWMASIDGSPEIKIWEFTSGREIHHFSGHQNATTALAYHPLQNNLVSADASGQLISWSPDGTITGKMAHDSKVTRLLFSSSGDTIFSLGGNSIKLWTGGTHVDTWTTKINQVQDGAIDRDSRRLIVGGSGGQLELFDLNSGRSNQRLTVSESEVLCLQLAGVNLYIGTQSGELIKLNLMSNERSAVSAFSQRTFKIAYQATSDQLVACGRDGKLNLKTFDSTLKETNLISGWREEPDREEFAFGLRILTCPTDTTLLLSDYDNHIRAYDFKNGQWIRTFEGTAAAIYDLSINPEGTQLAIASNHEVIKVLDLTGTKSDITFSASPRGSRAIDFHPVNPVLAAFGLDEQITLTNLINQQTVFSLKANGDYSTTPVNFDPTGRYVLRKSSEEDFDFYNFKTNKPQNLKVKNGKHYVFSPDGRKLIFQTSNGITIYDPITFQKRQEINLPNVQDIAISKSGNLAVLLRDDVTTNIYRVSDFQQTASFSLEQISDQLTWTPDGRFLIGVRNSVKRGEPASDYTLKVFDSTNGKLSKTLPGHAGFTYDIEFVNGKMLTAGLDGMIRIWALDNKTNEPLGLLVPLNGREYVIITPAGLFDATSDAMKGLHYTKAGKVIDLDQIKEHYYEPKLLSKVLGINTEPIRPSSDLAGVGLYPKLSIEHPLKNEGKLGINLQNNGGGIGRILILINGKEVSNDVRSASNTPDAASLEIDYDITDHPFLYNDRVNKITIKAYNEDGTLSSDEQSLYVFGEKKSLEPPSLFAIIAGSSDYQGESLDLKYAAKDATDLANALELSASKYLGAEKTNITLLTTDQDQSLWPTKANIVQAFERYKTKAKANDILFVYLSGHGVNHSGAFDDFYYLTCSAENGDMNNREARVQTAISSSEFTEYIKSVPALKQIMIIDACHSGRLASTLGASRSVMSSTQIRALERMKDRTGLFVLAGSAADAVSYETTLYDQGLLTYSLLFGMKGAALRDDEFIDVVSLFQFAANKVPELAEEIGGIQKPEISVPTDGKSFDIGRLSPADREQIKIAAPKPVYVHTRFQDESAIFDRLQVSDLLDAKLIELSKSANSSIVFVDDKDFSGATIINGRYEEIDGLIKARLYFIKDGEVVSKSQIESVNANELTDQVIATIRNNP